MFTYTLGAWILGLISMGCVAYLLLLLLAAAMEKRYSAHNTSRADRLPSRKPLTIAVIVPAHDEELVLEATLESLKAQDYPPPLFEIVVVADNCTDATAQIARQCGVTVLERLNDQERGKGYALDWAISQLLARPLPADAYVIVDADTWVAPDFLRLMEERLVAHQDAEGCCALQGRYGVLNRRDGWRAALMAGAFDLVNHVRPLGVQRLGLSVSLKGNGMAFTRAVLQRAPWRGHSITEDLDYGLDLVRYHHIRVGYVAEACVLAQMPVSAAQAASQRTRWEKGRYRLLRERALPLLLEGLRRRDLCLWYAGLELLMPPLAELALLLSLWGMSLTIGWHSHLLGKPGYMVALFGLSVVGFVAYVLGGFGVAGAPREAYRALLQAPFYIVWKFALYAVRFVPYSKRKQDARSEWVRTERIPVTASQSAEASSKPAGE